MSSPQAAIEYVMTHQTHYLQKLIEFLRIPSVGTSPAHRADMERAAQWLASFMEYIGLHSVQLISTDLHPVVYGAWGPEDPETPTLLVYGHYDVQPADPEEQWHTPPFEPTIQDGKIYARGASDDKGQLLAHLIAAEAYLRTSGKLPINLKFFIEGQEECGSTGLEDIIQQHRALLTCDAVAISDDGFWDATTPKITIGTRGLVYFEVDIRGPRHDLHSGTYGGAVHNPLQVAAEMIAQLHDAQGRVAIPGFYEHVQPLSAEERYELERIPFDEERFLHEEIGAPALWLGELGYSLRERITARPTLEIHGIRGGFVAEGQKTVIPAEATIKLSMRLVPDQDPLEIAHLFEEHIRRIAPPTVRVSVRLLSHAYPALIDRHAPAIQAAVEAYHLGFGTRPVFLRTGGTLPVVADFMRILQVPVVMMGFGLPDDNLHAPNEKLSLAQFFGGIRTAIHFMECLAQQLSSL
ncbi:MAG: dipeptidase [Ardenticatenia bacterium]|nr:MAG: dipeptidase [Ardenticatenia bacterium]